MAQRAQINVSVPVSRLRVIDRLRSAARQSRESRSQVVVDAIEAMAELMLGTHRSSRELLRVLTEDPSALSAEPRPPLGGAQGTTLFVAALNAAMPGSWRGPAAFGDVAGDRSEPERAPRGRIRGRPALDVDWQD